LGKGNGRRMGREKGRGQGWGTGEKGMRWGREPPVFILQIGHCSTFLLSPPLPL